MTTESEKSLAECLGGHLISFNEIDDNIATSSTDCNFENYEEFTDSIDMEIFSSDFKPFLESLMKKTEDVLKSGEKCDVRNVFESSGVETMKFNLFIWFFLENGKRSDSGSDQVECGVYAACCYISMCALTGSRSDLYQSGLYDMCLKIARNCCHTIRIGETVTNGHRSEKAIGVKKKNTTSRADDNPSEEEVGTPVAMIGPPQINVSEAEIYLRCLTTQYFGFLKSDSFSIEAQQMTNTLELIEDIGRIELDMRVVSKAYRANSFREFKCLDRFADRYCALVHVMIESKYPTKREMTFGRLIRPRLALIPYPDESTKTSKISTERKRAGELALSLVLSRVARVPEPKELKLVETILIMVYSQCPDFAEFRTNIALFVYKILEVLPYNYTYDFVQLMHTMTKGRAAGVKSLSNEIVNILITSYDFTEPDPGPVPDLEKEDEDDLEKDGDTDSEAESEAEAQEGENSDESEDEGNKSKRRKAKHKKEEKKKKEKKAKKIDSVERMDALSILYNIVYMSCLDKTASLRLHGSSSLAKILDSEIHRAGFQQFCQSANTKMNEKSENAGDDLNESVESLNISNETRATKNKKPTDILLNDQNIIEKWNRLKQMNKGDERTENDIIYMIVRRLATDDKAPVKKSACPLIKSFLAFCDDELKFDVVLSLLQKLCRDKMVTVRKSAADAFTDLMLCDSIVFKKILSNKWLDSLISMLNDTDNDVTEHARKLIMKVLSPLLENPSDLTWTLLNSIESVSNQRNYLMSTLQAIGKSDSVHLSVMDSMKKYISEKRGRTNGAWMTFSQLCVVYSKNVDFAIEAFNRVELENESEIVKYMIHIIENNITKIDPHTKKELLHSLQSTFSDFCLHSSHARSVYHCFGKLMDGIGDTAQNVKEFQDFGEELLIKCFDTIVQSFDMFKDKDEWKRNAESQERLLCTALNVVSEVFSYSPQLIPRHERLGKTLSLIVNSNDNHYYDASTINPDMPSAIATRPPTQMSEAVSSQKTTAGMSTHEGIMFSEKVRAVSVITLSNMILAHDRLLKLMPMLVKQLQYNPSHQIRSNVVLAIGDICSTYKTDRYAPMLAASLCDPSVIVRRHAINQIARLISLGIFRFNGEIMIRMMMATLDANEDVRNDAKLYISEVLQSEEPDFFPLNFVQYMIALTQAKRLVGVGHDEEDRGQVDVAIGGGDSLARPSRIAIYTFMIESLDDRSRFDVKMSICNRVFTPIVNGEYDFGDRNVQSLLDDALLIMSSSEMQVKMDVGKNPNENALDDPSPEVMEAASGFMQKVYLDHYMKTIVPSILALREFLNQHRSPLQRKCLLAIRMICVEHSKDIDQILQDNRQLKDEMMFELQRVKQRSEEAHRILNDAIRKVSKYNKQQRKSLQSPLPVEREGNDLEQAEQLENQDVEMTSPVRISADAEDVSMKTPEKKRNPLIDDLKTPATALRSRTEERSTPQSRLLSPKTMKKIRRSVGALIQNDMCLNAPNLEETCVDEEQLATSRRTRKTTEKDKDIVEEPMEQEKTIVEERMDSPLRLAAEEQKSRTEITSVNGNTRNVENALIEEPVIVQQEANKMERAEAEKDEDDEDTSQSRRRSRRRKTPNYNEDESVDADGKVWKKPKIGTKSPEKEDNISSNITLRRNRRGRPSEPEVVEKQQKARKRKASSDEEEEKEATPSTSENVENNPAPRGETPLIFDESKLGGRQCSTPIRGRDSDPGDVTFSLNISAITENEQYKNRRSQKQILHKMFDPVDEEEEDD